MPTAAATVRRARWAGVVGRGGRRVWAMCRSLWSHRSSRQGHFADGLGATGRPRAFMAPPACQSAGTLATQNVWLLKESVELCPAR